MALDDQEETALVRRLGALMAGQERLQERLDTHRQEAREAAQRLSEKIDSVRTGVENVTAELYFGRDGRQPVTVRLAQLERRTSPPQGIPAANPLATLPYRAPSPSVTEEAAPPVPVALGQQRVERWKIVAGIIGGVVTAVVAIVTAVLATR